MVDENILAEVLSNDMRQGLSESYKRFGPFVRCQAYYRDWHLIHTTWHTHFDNSIGWGITRRSALTRSMRNNPLVKNK